MAEKSDSNMTPEKLSDSNVLISESMLTSKVVKNRLANIHDDQDDFELNTSLSKMERKSSRSKESLPRTNKDIKQLIDTKPKLKLGI